VSGPPWTIGQRVQFATFDAESGDERELDGTYGTVLKVSETFDLVCVSSDYGDVWIDPYALMEPTA
jgi:hypothetical protein